MDKNYNLGVMDSMMLVIGQSISNLDFPAENPLDLYYSKFREAYEGYFGKHEPEINIDVPQKEDTVPPRKKRGRRKKYSSTASEDFTHNVDFSKCDSLKNAIRKLSKESGMSLTRLAGIAGIGGQTWSNITNGQLNFSNITRQKLESKLGLPEALMHPQLPEENQSSDTAWINERRKELKLRKDIEQGKGE